MALKKSYQGIEVTKDRDSSTYKETFYGLETQVDSFSSTLVLGTKIEGKGYLKSWTKTQKDGHFFQIEVEYSISYNSSWNDSDEETITGQKSAQLSVRNIQVPLQAKENYKTTWNHYLISCSGGGVPSWAADSKEPLIPSADRGKYLWIKSVGEVPTEKDPVTGQNWEIVIKPSKPGTEYFDVSVFVVSESAKFKTASAAGNFIKKGINTIIDPGEDFNLGGQWKLDGSSIAYDGKYWIATNQYTRAIDKWDRDLYD